MRFRVKVDPETCNGYGGCVESCVYNVLEIIDNIAYPVAAENCKGCKDCLRECRARIRLTRHLMGLLFH